MPPVTPVIPVTSVAPVTALARCVAPVVLALLGLGAGGRRARADHCQPLIDAPADALGLSARLHFESAIYERALSEGSWSGLSTELGGGWGRWQARGWIGAYQLDRNGVTEQGIGDAGLETRVTAWRSESAAAPLRLGPRLAMTLPTGDAATGFGMGHAMVMPGLWWSLPGQRFSWGGLVAYGRALGAMEGHHHGPGPIIDPMNSSEVLASAGLNVALIGQLDALLTASYARPLVDNGAARGAAGLGLLWNARPVHLGATVQLPLVGDAFRVRAIASAGLGF